MRGRVVKDTKSSSSSAASTSSSNSNATPVSSDIMISMGLTPIQQAMLTQLCALPAFNRLADNIRSNTKAWQQYVYDTNNEESRSATAATTAATPTTTSSNNSIVIIINLHACCVAVLAVLDDDVVVSDAKDTGTVAPGGWEQSSGVGLNFHQLLVRHPCPSLPYPGFVCCYCSCCCCHCCC